MLKILPMLRYIVVMLAIAGVAAGSTRADQSTDYTVLLDHFVAVTLSGETVRLAVHDDGPLSIRVSISTSPSTLHFQKADGFDQKDIETPIYSHGRSTLYYVNAISDKVGYCILRVRSQ